MATKTYKCTNFGECDLALSNELIEIEEGEDVVCPSCSKTSLVEPTGKGKAAGAAGRKLAIVGVAMVVLVGLAWLLWPSPPDPNLANSLLSDFFQRLPK